MSYTTKRKVMNSSVYLVIALVAVAVLMVSAVTAASMRSKKPSPAITDGPATSSQSKTPHKSPDVTPSAPTPSKTESPSVAPSGDQPAIDPVAPPEYYLPTAGAVFKDYSMDVPVFSLTMNDYRAHTGVDISAEIGSAVVSMTDGVVSNVWNDPLMGMCISVDHGDGLVSHYKNLSLELPEGIAIGTEVKAGQTIAAVGDSCLVELAEADHLHFELTKQGAHLDPMNYLNERVK